MFKRLIQGLKGQPVTNESRKAAESNAPATDQTPADLITVYDVHGREMKVTRTDWRDRVLLPELQAKWNEPDALYGLIINALSDGFTSEVDAASQQLLVIDPMVERGHVMRAIVLMRLGWLDQAERTLRDAVAKVGESGTILTNLAKAQEARGNSELAATTLWRAISLDPNQDNGLGWWVAREREQGGEVAYLAALEKVALLPGSWRAKLWLARHNLAAGDPATAIDQFRAVLAAGAHDRDTLLTISGDLGNAGKIEEFVELVAPHYDPARHAPEAGFNLLQAYLQLDRIDEGADLLDRLYALNLPPFKQHLDDLAQRFQDRRRATAQPRPVSEDTLEIAHLPFDRPIWMYGLRDPEWIFPPKPVDARKVIFLMLGKVMDGKQHAEEQREDEIGRLSRAIPLYLAESAYEWTPLHAQFLAAAVMGGGPAVFGAQDEQGERETATRLVELADLVVQGSIAEAEGRWTVSISIRDTTRGELIASDTVSAETGIETAVLEL